MDPTAEEYLFLRTSRAHIRSFSTQCLCHIEYNTTADYFRSSASKFLPLMKTKAITLASQVTLK